MSCRFCASQVSALVAGLSNLVCVDRGVQQQVFEVGNRVSGGVGCHLTYGPGELEFEALMRMLDNQVSDYCGHAKQLVFYIQDHSIKIHPVNVLCLSVYGFHVIVNKVLHFVLELPMCYVLLKRGWWLPWLQGYCTGYPYKAMHLLLPEPHVSKPVLTPGGAGELRKEARRQRREKIKQKLQQKLREIEEQEKEDLSSEGQHSLAAPTAVVESESAMVRNVLEFFSFLRSCLLQCCIKLAHTSQSLAPLCNNLRPVKALH